MITTALEQEGYKPVSILNLPPVSQQVQFVKEGDKFYLPPKDCTVYTKGGLHVIPVETYDGDIRLLSVERFSCSKGDAPEDLRTIGNWPDFLDKLNGSLIEVSRIPNPKTGMPEYYHATWYFNWAGVFY